MKGIAANDSTLLITVGLPNRPLCAGSGAFVGVADDVFAVGAGLRHGLPFDAGRETGAAAAAQSGCRDISEDGVRIKRQRAFEPLVAAVGAVIFDRAWIDHAATREGQTGLPLQPGNLLGDTEP